MTLIVSEAQEDALILISDGRTSEDGIVDREDFEKILYFEPKNKAVSFWGKIPRTIMDGVLELVNSLPDDVDLPDMAKAIADYYNANMEDKYKQKLCGVHVSGFREVNGTRQPCIFHVCNYDSNKDNSDGTKGGFHENNGEIVFYPQNDIDIDNHDFPNGRANGTQEPFIASLYTGIFRAVDDITDKILVHNKKSRINPKVGQFDRETELVNRAREILGQMIIVGNVLDKRRYQVVGGIYRFFILNEKGLLKTGILDTTFPSST